MSQLTADSETIQKHDRHLTSLYEKLKDQYTIIYRNIPLWGGRNRLIGEIDMIGIHNDGVDIFEIKCSHRVVKARKQLKKIQKIIGAVDDPCVNLYFYCGNASQLVRILN